MTLQGSGAISLAQVQGEFGGSAPISISEYYRGGAYVPTQVAYDASYWEGPIYQPSPNGAVYDWVYRRSDAGGATLISWGASVDQYQTPVGGTGYSINGDISSYTVGNVTYYRDAYVNWYFDGFWYAYTLYYVKRYVSQTGYTTLNTGIPGSGTISMSQFYGGRKT